LRDVRDQPLELVRAHPLPIPAQTVGDEPSPVSETRIVVANLERRAASAGALGFLPCGDDRSRTGHRPP
jgi:hypothetical protein